MLARREAATLAILLLSALTTAVPAWSQPAKSTSDPLVDVATLKIVNDKYSTTLDVRTRGVEKKISPSESEIFGLIAAMDKKTGQVAWYVQWAIFYKSRTWRKYQTATDSHGEALSLAQGLRKPFGCGAGGCTLTEVYDVYFSEEQIGEAALKGIDFKISSNEGDGKIVQIPATVVQAYIDKVAEADKLRMAMRTD